MLCIAIGSFVFVASIDIWIIYCKLSDMRGTKSQNFKLFSSPLAVVFGQVIEARCWDENEDIVGAGPTSDAPTRSEWSTI